MTDRLPIFPSRANHILMKNRVQAAIKGLNMMKRKRDALELKLREYTNRLKREDETKDMLMQDAFLAVAKASFLGTDFKPCAMLCPERADIFLRIRSEKTVGLYLPSFELMIRPATSFPFTGLARGGEEVEDARVKFQATVRVLITIASLEYQISVLQLAVRESTMRHNGLEYVVIPRYQRTMNYIISELDEFEREDFYRLKCSQKKQRKVKDKFTQMIKARGKSLYQSGHSLVSPTNYGIDQPFNFNEFAESDNENDI